MSFLNAAILTGLAVVVIPPIVHLFSRKKYDEVDWAAMQFLQVSPKTRRKVVFEQFLLMLLRMLVLVVLVLALAAPTISAPWLNRLVGHWTERDVVILIDGSASMSYAHNGTTGTEAARAWASRLIDTLTPGDRVAIYVARRKAVPLLENLSTDHDQARNALELLPPARGGVDWPSALQTAHAVLDTAREHREVIILTDGQRYGFADQNTLARWEGLGLGTRQEPAPAVWIVNVAPERPADPSNRSLDPIITGRAVAAAGREITFKSGIRSAGSDVKDAKPRVKLEIDGRAVQDLPIPSEKSDNGIIPLEFKHKFPAGSHLITLVLEDDDFPGDNRQDFALEVLPAIPVLIVDGGDQAQERNRRSDFLRDALAPLRDPTPSFLVRTVAWSEFSATLFAADIKGPGTSPRVVIFVNVPEWTKDQSDAVDKFLQAGGSVLITLGDRVDATNYNRVLFRAGQGWLPARLIDPTGNLEDLIDAARPLPSSFQHPMLESFREALPGGLQTAYFPRYWKLDTGAGINGTTGAAIAIVSTGDPLFVERGAGRGRVLISAVPLDNSWRTNLHTLPDFVRLAHESAYYLAGARSAERNLAPGQSILFSPRPPEPPGVVVVQTPEIPTQMIPSQPWPLVYSETHEPGAYQFSTTGGRNFYYAVRSDPLESLLTPMNDDDQALIRQALPGSEFITEPGEIEAKRSEGPVQQELWWLFVLLVILFLGAEVLYTRTLSARGNGETP